MFVPIFDRARILAGEAFCAFEDRSKSVIVLLFQWVEFVIMTSRAAECHGCEDLSSGVDLFVDRIHNQFFHIWFSQHLGTQDEESGCSLRLLVRIR